MFSKFLQYSASRLVVFAAQLALIPVAVSQVGVTGYGRFNLILQIAFVVRILTIQAVAQVLIRDSTMRAEYDQRNTYRAASVLVASSLFLVGLLLEGINAPLSSLLGISHQDIHLALAIAAALSLFGIKQVFTYLVDLRRYTILDASQIVIALAAVAIAGIALPDVTSYAVAYAVAVLIFSVVPVPRREGGRRAEVLHSLWGEVRTYGAILMVAEGLNWIVSVLDRFQIASMLGLAEAGKYTAAYQVFVAPIGMLGFAISLVVQPTTYNANEVDFRRRMDIAASLLLIVSSGVFAVGVVAGPWIMSLASKGRFSVDRSLVACLLLAGIGNSFLYLEMIAGKYGRQPYAILKAQALAACVIVFGNWYLLPRMGIIAAAATTLLSYVLQIVVIRRLIDAEHRVSYLKFADARKYASRTMLRSTKGKLT
jgi:O-antigen/teichoic acid export membrane protein